MLLSVGVLATPQAAILLVPCWGKHRLSDDRTQLDCNESYVLTGPQGALVTGYSKATANLNRGDLAAAAIGAHIRDTEYHGRQASSIILDTLTVSGEWRGSLPVTISMRVNYRFDGFGESRLDTGLQLTPSNRGQERNRAAVRVLHTGFGGAPLFNVDSAGNHQVPGDGPYPSASFIELLVTQMLRLDSPVIDLRAELQSYALPSIGHFGTTLVSLVAAQATIRVSSPCPVEITSDSGEFMAKKYPGAKIDVAVPAGDSTWVCTSE